VRDQDIHESRAAVPDSLREVSRSLRVWNGLIYSVDRKTPVQKKRPDQGPGLGDHEKSAVGHSEIFKSTGVESDTKPSPF
jgi:hypothetical protein